MAKLIVAALVIALIIIGIYFGFISKTSFLSQNASQSPIPAVVNNVKKMTPTVVATDQDLDSDLTALDKDLSEIEKGEAGFNQEVSGL